MEAQPADAGGNGLRRALHLWRCAEHAPDTTMSAHSRWGLSRSMRVLICVMVAVLPRPSQTAAVH